MQRLLNWWDHVTWAYPEGIALVGIVALGGLGVGGYFAAKALSSNGNTDPLTKKHVVTTLVPQTRTVNGHVVRYKVRRVVHYTPIYKRVVRTINGKTITTRKLVGRRAVTVSRVVTSARTSTVRGPGQTVTGPGKTVTGPGQTVVVTQTVTESRTETSVVPTTVTEVSTTTIPVTVTVTETVTTDHGH
ncbi:MAG TPA: hypothetical protein VHQ99_00570 [Gaiellaceae bacterium]|jgi:hypothetical protein|nr:hypothetical protein [Gaiellaceae bacterium]